MSCNIHVEYDIEKMLLDTRFYRMSNNKQADLLRCKINELEIRCLNESDIKNKIELTSIEIELEYLTSELKKAHE